MDGTAELRESMLAQVLRHSPVSEAVAEALRLVPRHAFLPEIPVEEAYIDEAIVTKRDPDGLPISSSSQPTIMAIMLDQLGVRPGHRVLEIGAGTGYNAALIAALVGPDGAVVSVDIDADLVLRAREHLDAAGCAGVSVVCADGYDGFPARAPYDRVIATVGVWDLAPAWLDQLHPDGRIVVPLDLRGVQRSVALEPADGHLRSLSIVPCGFMRLRGAYAGPEKTVVLDDGLSLFLPEGGPVGDLLPALDSPAVELDTGVLADHAEVLDGLGLWLAVHEPAWCTLTETASARLPRSPFDLRGFAMSAGIADGDSLALLASGPVSLTAHGHGPEGALLAGRLVAHVRSWDTAGRPMSDDLRITAHRRPAPTGTLVKTHTMLDLTWTTRHVGT
ncbi:methyltransferase, FxLD system [Streptosporangium sp. KLBMP 9127]|nr:methyltransferase, FxLD system [Streptosporangium sp. KLBMP 9127]